MQQIFRELARNSTPTWSRRRTSSSPTSTTWRRRTAGGGLPMGPFGTVLNPVRVMEADHALVGELLGRAARPVRRLRPAGRRLHDLQVVLRRARTVRARPASPHPPREQRPVSAGPRTRAWPRLEAPAYHGAVQRADAGRAGADPALPARQRRGSRAPHVGRVAARLRARRAHLPRRRPVRLLLRRRHRPGQGLQARAGRERRHPGDLRARRSARRRRRVRGAAVSGVGRRARADDLPADSAAGVLRRCSSSTRRSCAACSAASRSGWSS